MSIQNTRAKVMVSSKAHYLSVALLLAGTMNTAFAFERSPTSMIAPLDRSPAYEVLDDRIMLKRDAGGDVDGYAEFFKLIEQTQMPVWVTDRCHSACTMILRNPKACAMPKAIFGFHSARLYNKATLEIMGVSDNGNRLLWSHYPDKVKIQLGGRLSADTVHIKGTDLLPPCK